MYTLIHQILQLELYILAQPRKKNIDVSISYASRQLNSAEHNCTIIEHKELGKTYAIKRFWHHILENKFIFFVDHKALLYLVKKPCNIDI